MGLSALEGQIVFSVIRMLGFFVFATAVPIALVWWLRSSSGAPLPSQAPEADFLEPIRRTDPAFTWDAFRARALSAHAVVQRARMVKQPNLAQAWVTEAQLAGLENEAAYAARTGAQRTVAPVTVTQIGPRSIRTNGTEHLLDTRIVSETTAVGYGALMNISDAESLPAQANGLLSIDEIWTFSRPIGAQTPSQPSGSRHCAHCGAPVDEPGAVSCPYCGEVLHASDWLVAAIAPTDFLPTGAAQLGPQPQTGVS